jgi:hypothetical protein
MTVRKTIVLRNYVNSDFMTMHGFTIGNSYFSAITSFPLEPTSTKQGALWWGFCDLKYKGQNACNSFAIIVVYFCWPK